MSLRFYLGSSGSGKSTSVYKEMIERSILEPDTVFLIIVPDQFTMQTQKELCTLHERGGIMNIDVLSFSRLCYRIFEEIGVENKTVLDDTGKNLVLRKVAADLEEELVVLGTKLHRIGYIHEIKSVISEFLQYDIGVKEAEELTKEVQNRGQLSAKLRDLTLLYQGFLTYIQDKFITTEESLTCLKHILSQSEIMKDAVVVFDGFTGFTPVQNSLISEILLYAREVIVTLTMEITENPYEALSEHKLFYLTNKTMKKMQWIADENHIIRGGDVLLKDNPRFVNNKSMAFLEKNMLRYTKETFPDRQDSIFITEALNPKEEIQGVCLKIKQLLRTSDYCYRDISVVTGDLESYSHFIRMEMERYNIPCFLDQTRGLLAHPCIAYIVNALEVVTNQFSYESVAAFLRSGFTGIEQEEIDLFDNYIYAMGIRGKKRYLDVFIRRSPDMTEETAVEDLERLNAARVKVVDLLMPLFVDTKMQKADKYVNCLYQFCVISKLQQKMDWFSQQFEKKGELANAKEYAQVYAAIMDLLNQIYELLGTEEMELKEFREILEAGFCELNVGTIPQNVDQVIVGDIERTRLKKIKALFFVGVNDGIIPRNASNGGLISDMEREYLLESGKELAPTNRQQMFIQKLYLYINMTKPSEKLYLSYAKMDSSGKTLTKAYLIDNIQKLYPLLSIEHMQDTKLVDCIESRKDGLDDVSLWLGQYASGLLKEGEEKEREFMTLYHLYGKTEESEMGMTDVSATLEKLTEAAFYQYESKPLSREAAKLIYGDVLQNSVSRLEQFAGCAYAHFMRYGLALKEKHDFSFEAVDMGTVFHDVLAEFACYLEQEKETWFGIQREAIEEFIEKTLMKKAVEYGETVLYDTARNTYILNRMQRILNRTILTLQYQLKKGLFTPKAFELPFSSVKELMADHQQMRLSGRIDRVDTMEQEGKIYVKVLDYKTGNLKFDPISLYYGLQMQLAVYMDQAVLLEQQKNPEKEVIPAALLYYHMNDPYVERPGEAVTDADIEQMIREEMRMEGLVNENDSVVMSLDREFAERSDVIPVERKKSGEYKANASIASVQDFASISAFVNKKIADIGNTIFQGDISVKPYEKGTDFACQYCNYRSVCKFDEKTEGFVANKLDHLSKEDAMERIRKEV